MKIKIPTYSYCLDYVRSKVRSFCALCTARRVISVAICGAVVIGVCIFTGWYPVMIVNGHCIWAREVHKSSALGYAYYLQGKKGVDQKSFALIKKEIDQAVFESFIDGVLIDAFLSGEMKKSDLEKKMQMQMDAYENNEYFKKVYFDTLNIPKADVERYYLRSLVAYDMLESSLRLENKTGIDWILGRRMRASVRVLLPHMHWDGKRLLIQ